MVRLRRRAVNLFERGRLSFIYLGSTSMNLKRQILPLGTL